MSTSLTTPGANGAPVISNGAVPSAGLPPVEVAASKCPKCGSPMQNGQDWCLQCGAGVPGSLAAAPGWRTGVAILGTTALLVVGASVAAYAALNKTKHKPAVVALAVRSPATAPSQAVTPTTGAPAPGTATPGTATPGTATPQPGIPTTVKATPPKIPLQTPTPKSAAGANTEANNALFPPETKTTKTTTTPTKTTSQPKSTSENSGSKGGSETKTSAGGEAPSPILLDTNAATTYNPYSYPSSLFGDPTLAIDGEEKTAWTAQVQAAAAPKMAEGLVLDLKSPQKLGSVAVKTTTIGATVEIYGSTGHTLPASISDPRWKRLVGLKVLKKKSTTLRLKTNGNSYRFIVLWLAKAPNSSSTANPGGVSINEFELFPPA